MSGPDRIGVLFVCLGNICRSPLAEGIFLDLARRKNLADRFDADSCGTGGWHAGEGADPRSVGVALAHGIRLDHEARQFDPARDLARFRWILAMDRSNLRDIRNAAETHGLDASRARLILSFAPGARPDAGGSLDVPDPYYGGADGFERVFGMLAGSCAALMDAVLAEPHGPGHDRAGV